MRGEYYLQMRGEWEQTELPPRARRIPPTTATERKNHGTTSACAENTELAPKAFTGFGNYLRVRGEYYHQKATSRHYRNYLRVRGEYVVIHFTSGPGVELPPRARRIHPQDFDQDNIKGTTSACAENTVYGAARPHRRQNYLRVRGEY